MASLDILSSVIGTQYLDNGNFDVYVKLPQGYAGDHNSLVIKRVSGANAFLVSERGLNTPEITIDAYVTKHQDSLLRLLYIDTVHPGYIDQRHPIAVQWGDISSAKFSARGLEDGTIGDDGMEAHEFYLAEYTPPSDVEFAQATLLSVSMKLRLI